MVSGTFFGLEVGLSDVLSDYSESDQLCAGAEEKKESDKLS